MLQKRNKHKNVYYKTGDIISFRVKDDKSKYKGVIVTFEDSAIVFKGYKIHVNQITRLYIDEKTKWWLRFKIEQILLLGGSAYLLLDVINNNELSEETLIICGISIGAGLFAKWLIGNRIKIRGRTKLRILNFHDV